MKKYLLIQGDEDGNPNRFMTRDELEEILADCPPQNILTEIPEETDPNYWDEEDALILEVRVLRVRPVTTAYELE